MAEQAFHVTDPAMLKALSHPLRQRILWELGVREHARAADLAPALELPANSVSFHLRALAKAGLVVEAPELARDGRDRVWTPAHNTLDIDLGSGNPTAVGFVRTQLEWVRETLQSRPSDEDPVGHKGMVSAALLTKAEATALRDEVDEVLERWRLHGAEAAAEHPDDPSRVFHTLMFLTGGRLDDSAAS